MSNPDGFSKPNRGGRPKGAKGALNKLRDDLLDTFNAIGGKNRLIRHLKEDPAAYMEFIKLIVKLIPREQKLTVDTVTNYITQTPRPIQIEGEVIEAPKESGKEKEKLDTES